jgi:hypothetical protein
VRERERERKKTLDDGDTSWSPGMLAGNCLGWAGLKEGEDVPVGKWTTGRKETLSQRKRCCKHSPWKKRNSDALLGYSGQTALRREQCGVFALCRNCWATEASGHARNGKLQIVSAYCYATALWMPSHTRLWCETVKQGAFSASPIDSL